MATKRTTKKKTKDYRVIERVEANIAEREIKAKRNDIISLTENEARILKEYIEEI